MKTVEKKSFNVAPTYTIIVAILWNKTIMCHRRALLIAGHGIL